MPSLKRVNFNEILTFDRNTDKTGFVLQSDGFGNQVPTLKVFAPNEPAKVIVDPLTKERLGISIHGQRTNLLRRSEDFQVSPWASTLGANSGASTRENIQTSLGIQGGKVTVLDENQGGVRQQITGLASSTSHVFSVYVETIDVVLLRVQLENSSAYNGTGTIMNFIINLTTGQVTGVSGLTVTIKAIGNGYLIYVNFGPSRSDQQATANIELRSFDGVSGRQFIVAAPQLEAGAFPTPYIKTEGTTVTRLADDCRILNIDQSDWWNPSEGTFVVEFDGFAPRGGTINYSPFSIVGSQNLNWVFTSVSNLNNTCSFGLQENNNTSPIVTLGVISENINKISLSLGSSSFTASLNGQNAVSLPINGAIGSELKDVIIGSFATNPAQLNGTIKSITYTPRAMTAEELQLASQLGGA